MKSAFLVFAIAVICSGGCGNDSGSAADATTGDTTIDAAPPDSALPAATCSPLAPAGGGGGGANLHFVQPAAVTEAYQDLGGGNWQLVGPANWSCLGDGIPEAFPNDPVGAAGQVLDFQTGDPVPNAQVTVTECADRANQLDLATSGANGDFTLDVAVRISRWNLSVTATDYLDTFSANLPVLGTAGAQDLDLRPVSTLTANALPAFIGAVRSPGLGLMIGTIVDCDGNRVANAVATVSAQSGVVDHLVSAETYYFSALSTSLPVRATQQAVSNDDGLFMVLELSPTPAAFVQVWGFVDGQTPGIDPLTLISQVALPILADSFVFAHMDPIR